MSSDNVKSPFGIKFPVHVAEEQTEYEKIISDFKKRRNEAMSISRTKKHSGFDSLAAFILETCIINDSTGKTIDEVIEKINDKSAIGIMYSILISFIWKRSFTLFKKYYEFTPDQLSTYGFIADLSNTTPIQVAFGDSDYNANDAFMFNVACFNEKAEVEKREYEKMRAKYAK